ncbi:hypothetical protein RFI_13505 [Reticulomyxa filosa]|uniref:RZ-type domain-containing protein n=1 Tax=Reticulomyxa filosa TaxID=46433 RepID=X6NBK0_RETFI|nr:hypothetical protein RFI_13505 [Reticulomyxa filosa]|eukprot:ETO23675.1 hypothetical protein RFI_13505 [Reticulomyxa filosa]
MPTDEATSLLHMMPGCGVWLCPNDHMYFVDDCTATLEAANCPTCGASIGNKSGADQHVAAPGNRKVGVVSKNGKIDVDKWGATEGFVQYRKDLFEPKGYVIVDYSPEHTCRMLDQTSLCIVRLLVHLTLLMHACDEERSDAVSFTRLGKKDDEVRAKLFQLIQRDLSVCSVNIGGSSIENTILLIHGIIHRFYVTYPHESPQTYNQLSSTQRGLFENYFMNKCIRPVIDNYQFSIRDIRALVATDPCCRHWAERVEENMKPGSDTFKTFEEMYQPSSFLPFRMTTLSEFRNFVLSNPQNERQYPVIWTILHMIDSPQGYSIFALQYLPLMIQWMKLLHSHFNRQLRLEEVEESGQYTIEYALTQQEKNKWRDKALWERAWRGFAMGWNHVTSRIRVKPRSEQNHSVKQMQDESKYEIEDNENKSDAKISDDFGMHEIDTDLQKYRHQLRIRDAENQCQNLPFPQFLGSGDNNQLVPKDVPLWPALVCDNNYMRTSRMICLLLDHLVCVNNDLLGECWKSAAVEASTQKRTILLSHVLRERDVISLNEKELVELIQQSMPQKLQYGKHPELAYNLPLLEARLKEKVLVGKCIIKFDLHELIFEFQEQHNIRQIIASISHYYKKYTGQNEEYFRRDENLLRELEEAILQKVPQGIARERSDLSLSKSAKQSLEEVLISLRRQNPLPSPSLLIGDWMEKTLHLLQTECDLFKEMSQLQLRHAAMAWVYLEERCVKHSPKPWYEIPEKLMKAYQELPNMLSEALIKFVNSENKTEVWEVLIQWKQFLENILSRPVYDYDPMSPLKDYLVNAIATDNCANYVMQFPQEILLAHAGTAFNKAASLYHFKKDIL